jgi:hypothetical protein
MTRNDIPAVYIVTIYLVAYFILLQIESAAVFAMLMLLFSPVLICWMVYVVLKHGKYSGPGLGDDEFGYQDKQKKDITVL